MSKYSELIGSFVRRSEAPIEADYIFPSVSALKKFYSDPIQNSILHKGLLKVVESDEDGQQALYWVILIDGKYEFTKLISGDVVGQLTPKINEFLEALDKEIKERQNGDYAIWGTSNPTILEENLNSIYDIAEAIKTLTEKVEQGSIGALKGLVDSAYYDATYESLIIVFNLEDGNTQKLSIPMTNMIREWETDNHYPHKVVELTREEIYGSGADKLSADVRLSTRTDNIIEKDGNTLLVRGVSNNIDHNGTTLDVIIKRLQKRIAALEKLIEENEPEVVIPISITAFEVDCDLVNEIGAVLNPTFNWVYNISTVDAQTLNSIAVDIAARSKQLRNITEDTTITLFASYKGYNDSKELTFTFVPRLYYGSSISTTIIDIKELSGNKLMTYDNYGVQLLKGVEFDCSGGKYIYFAIPSTYKNRIEFYCSNFKVTAYTTSTINVVNSTGNTVEHTLFKLDNKYNGKLYFDIKIV